MMMMMMHVLLHACCKVGGGREEEMEVVRAYAPESENVHNNNEMRGERRASELGR